MIKIKEKVFLLKQFILGEKFKTYQISHKFKLNLFGSVTHFVRTYEHQLIN